MSLLNSTDENFNILIVDDDVFNVIFIIKINLKVRNIKIWNPKIPQ